MRILPHPTHARGDGPCDETHDATHHTARRSNPDPLKASAALQKRGGHRASHTRNLSFGFSKMRRGLFITMYFLSICVTLASAAMLAIDAGGESRWFIDWHPLGNGYFVLATKPTRILFALDHPLEVPVVEDMTPTQRKAWFYARRPRAIEWGGFHLFAGDVVISGASNIKHYDFRCEIGFPLWAS